MSFIEPEANILIASTVRDCESTLLSTISTVDKAFKKVKSKEYFFIESDSKDKTKNLLHSLSKERSDIKYLSLGFLQKELPRRTERIAFCRNKYLDYLRKNKNFYDYLIVIDSDGVCSNIQTNLISKIPKNWSCLAGNTKGFYYDLWALREDSWCSNNCWQSYLEMKGSGFSSYFSFLVSVWSKYVVIKPKQKCIKVKSAFGGLAIYKSTSIPDNASYKGIDKFGSEICEHVPFNESIGNYNPSNNIYIIPNLLIGYSPKEHIRYAGLKGLLLFSIINFIKLFIKFDKKIFFILNGFLDSQGGIEFITNCYSTVNNNWKDLNLDDKPQLIYIKKNFIRSFLHSLFRKSKYKHFDKFNSRVFKDYDIKEISLLNYYFLKFQKNYCFIGITNLKDLIVTDISYIFDCQHLRLKNYFSRYEIFYRNISFISNLLLSKSTLVNSKSVKKDLENYYPIVKKTKIKNLPFMPITKRNVDHKKVNIKDGNFDYIFNSKFILISNRWWKHKNHISVIKAFKTIKSIVDKEFGIEKCKIIMSGSLKGIDNKNYVYESANEYINKNQLENNIHIIGHVPDELHKQLFMNCIGIIQPTLFEGGPGGFSSWEAIGFSKPLACSDIEINQELLDYSKNIKFFNPYSNNELKKIILDLYRGNIKQSELLIKDHKKLEFNYAISIVKSFFNNL